jgi:ferrous iron transport protein A
MKRVSLVEMRARQKGRVVEIQGGGVLQSRLMALGIHPGREITKLSHFMLRGPVAVKIGRTVLALGHGMSSKIILELE